VLDPFSAIGTIDKIGIHGTPAMRAYLCSIPITGCQWSAPVIKICRAIYAHPEGNAFFNGKKRDEKKTQIMVHSFLADLWMTAVGAYLCPFCQSDRFGLNAPYKKEHLKTSGFILL
jgi:hypothetical protein